MINGRMHNDGVTLLSGCLGFVDRYFDPAGMLIMQSGRVSWMEGPLPALAMYMKLV